MNNRHQQLDHFLDSAKGRLFVVFDEAHHSPAPSYRRLIQSLRERCPQMQLMGLTATPTYSVETKRGWLTKLFPQRIIYQVEARTLMADGILARPIFEEAQTEINATFDEQDYEKWVGTNRDLPDTIISSLAQTRERNEYIANCYVAQRNRYGKTIIFADRWEQCEQLSEALQKRGVKADAIYSHVDANPGSVGARKRRTASENAKVLQAFRDGKLDVLINIRMATEGTDIPNVQTVFLTRQTTSQILLTQMIGRALRGPKFGGTDKAYIVSFIDHWKHHINWAAYEQLSVGIADETIAEYGKRPPLQLISIDLVRRLARQMDSGININPAPYKAFLPKGWYRVDYYAQVEGTDDIEPKCHLIMVFEDETTAFDNFIQALITEDLGKFEEDAVTLAQVQSQLDYWYSKYFDEIVTRVGSGLMEDLFNLARHIAQNEKQVPKFFPFEMRDHHDLDEVAQSHIGQSLDDRAKAAALRSEYTRQDRYWRIIYSTYPAFKSHYDACINRILDANELGHDPVDHRPHFVTPEAIPQAEPSEELKERVKSRDGYKCLCCGYHKQRKQLQVDHISPSYRGGSNQFDNLQTLCKICNGPEGKRIESVSFRNNQTTLTAAPSRLPMPKIPTGLHTKEPEEWEMFIRRSINLFYRCAAVDTVEIGAKGKRFRNWLIRLFPGNDELWLLPYLPNLKHQICLAKEQAGYEAAPDEITVIS